MSFVDSIISKALNFQISEEKLPLNELFDLKISELGITRHQAFQVLGLDKKTIEPILDYSAKSVDVLNVIKLAEFLDIKDIDSIIQTYTINLPIERVKEMEQVKKASFIVKNFNLESLKKSGFIKTSINDFESIEKRIVEFFGLKSIYEYTDNEYQPLFSRTKRATNNKMLDFWIRSALYQFRKINNPNDYDRDYLKDLITKIKPYCADEELGLLKVARALYNAGVTVIFQPHLSTTQIRGATFIVQGKPCIVLTDLNDRYPTVWFALLHELCHALFDYDKINESGFHLSLDEKVGDFFLDEKVEAFANSFARDYFLPASQLKYISPFIANAFMVKQYAESNSIHPSLIYAFYCWQMAAKGKNFWALYQQHFPSAKKLFNKINVVPFDFDKLEDSVTEVKKILETQNA